MPKQNGQKDILSVLQKYKKNYTTVLRQHAVGNYDKLYEKDSPIRLNAENQCCKF